jgi:prepilin-type processing-associated H-X9-DG protein
MLLRDNGRNYSYGYNHQFLGNSRLNSTTGKYIRWPRKLPSIKNLADTVMFADCMGTAAGKASSARQPYDAVLQSGTANGDSKIGNHAWALDPPRLVAGSSDYCNDSSRVPASRSAPYAVHSKFANIAFLDGHVNALGLQELGYSIRDNGAVDVNGTNRMFSGTGNDDTPPPIN